MSVELIAALGGFGLFFGLMAGLYNYQVGALKKRHQAHSSADEAYTAFMLAKMQEQVISAQLKNVTKATGELAQSLTSNGVLIVPSKPDKQRSDRVEAGKHRPEPVAAPASEVLAPTQSYCEMGEHLADTPDMVWVNDGMDYVCTDCASRHGFEIAVQPSSLAGQVMSATQARGTSPVVASPTPETPIEQPRGIEASGTGEDGSAWALIRTLGEAKELARRYGVQTITKEGPYYRIDVPTQHEVTIAESEMVQKLTAMNQLPVVFVSETSAGGVTRVSMTRERFKQVADLPQKDHPRNCPNLHSFGDDHELLACVELHEDSRVFGMDGQHDSACSCSECDSMRSAPSALTSDNFDDWGSSHEVTG